MIGGANQHTVVPVSREIMDMAIPVHTLDWPAKEKPSGIIAAVPNPTKQNPITENQSRKHPNRCYTQHSKHGTRINVRGRPIRSINQSEVKRGSHTYHEYEIAHCEYFFFHHFAKRTHRSNQTCRLRTPVHKISSHPNKQCKVGFAQHKLIARGSPIAFNQTRDMRTKPLLLSEPQ